MHQTSVWSPGQGQTSGAPEQPLWLVSLGEHSQPDCSCKNPSPQTCQSNPTLPLGARVMLDLLVLLTGSFARELVEPMGKGGGARFILGMPATRPPWNEQLKGSQGILIRNSTVWKGCGETPLLVLSSTPTTFSVVAKALLEIGPPLQSHAPPSHRDLKHSAYHLHLPSCPWLRPSWHLVGKDPACPGPLEG